MNRLDELVSKYNLDKAPDKPKRNKRSKGGTEKSRPQTQAQNPQPALQEIIPPVPQDSKLEAKSTPGLAQKRAERREQKKLAWLAAFSQSGIVGSACDAAGVGRRTVYEWREADSSFAQAWDAALEHSTDLLVAEARRQATEGTETIHYDKQGNETKRTYAKNPTLLMFLLKGRRPEQYRDNVKHQVEGGKQPIKIVFELPLPPLELPKPETPAIEASSEHNTST